MSFFSFLRAVLLLSFPWDVGGGRKPGSPIPTAGHRVALQRSLDGDRKLGKKEREKEKTKERIETSESVGEQLKRERLSGQL